MKLNHLIVFLLPVIYFAQTPDSLEFKNPLDDSLLTATKNSSLIDTLEKKRRFDVDDVIFANSSDSLRFDVKNKRMYLYGKGELKYKKSDLNSSDIAVDFETNTLEAQGKYDTSSSKLTDTPVLTEEGQVYEGTSIRYNFKTQQGYISLAKNVDNDKTYRGEQVKKVDRKTYFIEDGIYTTCDSDTPHTHFTASSMKVIQNDKIIARWIFMYIGGVPVPLPLPFAVFPNQSGRRSGIIVPTYGFDNRLGHTFRNMGYFWAISDYMDLMIGGDFYTKGGTRYRTRYRYKKRYEFSGNVNAEISNLLEGGEPGDPGFSEQLNWSLGIRHSQDINPTTSLNANLQFMSTEFLQNNRRNYNDYITQNITSNATFSKRWEESGTSLTLGYSRNQNLSNGNITEILPSMSFNMSQKYPFKREGVSRKDQRWYEYIGLSYRGEFRNRRTKTAFTTTVDSVTESGYNKEIRGGIQHNVTVNASPKIGYFSFSPSINYVEKWYDKRTKREYIERALNDGTTTYDMEEKDIKEISFVRTFDFRLSTSTKLYGTLQPEMLGIKAFRHTITPSISYQYQPDFSDDKWGYYDKVFNPQSGRYESYDKFSEGIFSGVSSGERQSINLSVGNLFEIKTEKDRTDTTSEEKKIQLLNLNASTGYNFAADSLNLDDLRLSFRTQIGDLLTFNGSSSYSFYDYAVRGNSVLEVNKFLLSEGKGFLRMTNLNFNISTNLSGDKISGEKRDGSKQNLQNNSDAQDEYDIDENDSYTGEGRKISDFTIPWNLGLNLTYNLNKFNPDNPVITANAGINLSLSLSQNWKLTFRGSYDLEQKKLNAPQITVYRDLHCWEMNFVWNPIGVWKGFRFEIRLKAPELRDLKVTKTKDIYSGY
ncbi:MAG: LPS-assembly protein LptD [Melioribacteraceae bacterium]|nr:LPS-assembly protein LptD [Melioribacteraceae bacterium]